jgi:hypothetical protein
MAALIDSKAASSRVMTTVSILSPASLTIISGFTPRPCKTDLLALGM